MHKIKAEKLTVEAFAPFGTFTSPLAPEGYHIGSEVHDFYRDAAVYYSEPGLPLGLSPLTVREHGMKVDSVEGVTATDVNLVFEPEWTQDMMSEEAKLELGFL